MIYSIPTNLPILRLTAVNYRSTVPTMNAAMQHLDSGPRDSRPLCNTPSSAVTCEINNVTCGECIRLHDEITDDAS